MIEQLLDLENKVVMVEKLEKLDASQLIQIREEIRLISNNTPKFLEVKEGPPPDFFTENKVISGFDALWASVNIAIAGRGFEEFNYHGIIDDPNEYDDYSTDSIPYESENYDYDDDYYESSYSDRLMDEYGEEGWESDDGHFFPDSWHPGD